MRAQELGQVPLPHGWIAVAVMAALLVAGFALCWATFNRSSERALVIAILGALAFVAGGVGLIVGGAMAIVEWIEHRCVSGNWACLEENGWGPDAYLYLIAPAVLIGGTLVWRHERRTVANHATDWVLLIPAIALV